MNTNIVPKLKKAAVAVSGAGYLLVARTALALDTGLSTTGSEAGFDTSKTDLAGQAGSIIGQLLGLIGVVFMILIITGGFMWMTAGGNEERVKKARGLIVSAIVGLVIITLAYSITAFVMGSLVDATS